MNVYEYVHIFYLQLIIIKSIYGLLKSCNDKK